MTIMIKLLTTLAAVLAISTLGPACSPTTEKPAGGSPSAPAITSIPGEVWTAKPLPQFTPTPAPAAAACKPASQALIDQVDAHLARTGQTLADAFVVDSPEGYQYVGGNIMEGETKNSSADVWIAQDGWVIYALSGSAREETPQLADARDLGLSAGDEYGQAVQECTITAERARNAAGGR